MTHPEEVEVACPPRSEIDLPTTFVDYEENPREYFLSSVSTVLDVHTRVSDSYSSPYDQIEEQVRNRGDLNPSVGPTALVSDNPDEHSRIYWSRLGRHRSERQDDDADR
jgi:hypothetical protein